MSEDFSPTGFKIKHVLMKALKWAAIGALALGAVAFIGPVIGGAIAGAIVAGLPTLGLGAPVGALIGAATGGAAQMIGLTGLLGAGVVHTALVGAGIAGAIGAISGLTGADQAADDQQVKVGDRSERAQMRQARLAMLQQQQAAGMVSPDGLPMGRGQGLSR